MLSGGLFCIQGLQSSPHRLTLLFGAGWVVLTNLKPGGFVGIAILLRTKVSFSLLNSKRSTYSPSSSRLCLLSQVLGDTQPTGFPAKLLIGCPWSTFTNLLPPSTSWTETAIPSFSGRILVSISSGKSPIGTRDSFSEISVSRSFTRRVGVEHGVVSGQMLDLGLSRNSGLATSVQGTFTTPWSEESTHWHRGFPWRPSFISLSQTLWICMDKMSQEWESPQLQYPPATWNLLAAPDSLAPGGLPAQEDFWGQFGLTVLQKVPPASRNLQVGAVKGWWGRVGSPHDLSGTMANPHTGTAHRSMQPSGRKKGQC